LEASLGYTVCLKNKPKREREGRMDGKNGRKKGRKGRREGGREGKKEGRIKEDKEINPLGRHNNYNHMSA
jgi:hypothetical protein